MSHLTTASIQSRVQKGVFQPHQYLSNLCLAHFQNAKGFVSGKIFPTIPVSLSTSFFYEFNKGDLARDNMARKPDLGKVSPAQFGHSEHLYQCEVHQVLTGINKLSALDFNRAGTPDVVDPRKVKTRFIAEQMLLHKDILWSNSYFNARSWSNVLTGSDNPTTSEEFYYFDNANSDPVTFFSKLSTQMALSGLRRPNKMCVGANVMAAFQSNPSILDRIKYQGSEANPANVTANVLAQLFGLEEILVSEAVYNKADLGQADEMSFVCNPNDVLLVYTTDMPSLEEPSAGYTFAWDMLGNGQYTPVLQYEGDSGTHTEIVEGLLATDHKITCKDLGVYLSGAVSTDTSL